MTYGALTVQLSVWYAVAAQGLSGDLCPLQAHVCCCLDHLCLIMWFVHVEKPLRDKIHTEF